MNLTRFTKHQIDKGRRKQSTTCSSYGFFMGNDCIGSEGKHNIIAVSSKFSVTISRHITVINTDNDLGLRQKLSLKSCLSK